ncbi:MAG: cell division protein FtsQ/DivIB [Candidatus Zixiibacteriota bacterium]
MLTLIGALAVVSIIKFTEVCNLQAVTINGKTPDQWDKKTPLIKDKSILRQPLDEFVLSSFANDQTLKLDFRYDWPHTLNVKVNSISPDCLLLDKYTSTLFGLDKSGAVLPLSPDLIDWERPVFTGVGVNKLYQLPQDIRVHAVVNALAETKSQKLNFYRLIEQIDFDSPDFLEVRIAGCPQIVRLRAEFFYEDINRYIDFVARFQPQLDGVKVIDLRQNGQIITKGKRA